MLRILALLIFLSGISVAVSASNDDLRAQLLPTSNDRLVLIPGDLFDGVIRVWPYYGKDPAFFKKMEGKLFLKYFYVASIEKMKFSKNNTDVLEIYAKIALKSEFEVTSFLVWEFAGLNIPITLKRLSSMPAKSATKDYIFYDQNVPRTLEINWPLVLIAVFVLFGIWFYFNSRIAKKRKAQLELARIKKEQQDELIKVFTEASTRKDIENILVQKSVWESFVAQEDPMIAEYLDWIGKNQYRRDWNDLDLQRMKNSSNEIGRKIQESNGV